MSDRKDYRGDRTHGRGRKAGRGAGKKGGRGNAGRFSHKKLSVIKNPHLYKHSKSGIPSFKLYPSACQKTINVGSLTSFMQNDEGIIDLNLYNYDILLGSGKVSSQFHVKVKKFSSKALEKIEQNKGTITIS